MKLTFHYTAEFSLIIKIPPFSLRSAATVLNNPRVRRNMTKQRLKLMNIHEAMITGTTKKQHASNSRIKLTNDTIRYQAECFARLENARHELTEKQFKAIKCLFIRIFRAASH
ncbi:MAG: hypothetical protein R3E62_04320 [Pseudomonadales bacterium]